MSPPKPQESPLRARKTPRQARSATTVDCILEAAARVLARESLAGFTTNRVAEVAGVSIGSLYQYFPGKDALAAALVEHAQDQLATALETFADRDGQRDLASTLGALAQLAVRQQYEQPLLAAALDHEERRLALGAVLRRTRARLIRAVARIIDRHRDELPADLPRSAPRDCLTIAQALVEADVGVRRRPARDLVARVQRALLGYLSPGARPRRKRMAGVG